MRKTAAVIALLCAALLLAAVASGGCGSSDKPNVESLNPTSGPAGTQVVVSGQKFGTTQGSGVVHVGEKVASVVAWTDTDVTVTVPSGLAAAPQGVTVINDKGESNQVNFTVSAGTAPQPDRKPGEVESNTPAQAMAAFMKKNGTDPTGYSYSVVKVSTVDPNWKIDKAEKGRQVTYFLLKKVNGAWTVVDDGKDLTPDELKGDGAPSDLWINVPGQSESNTPAQAMAAFMKKNGTDPTGYSYSVVKLSTVDPNWKIDRADKGQKTTYFLLKKVNGVWTVVDDGSALTPDELKGDGAPSDLWIQVPAPPPKPPENQVQVIQSYLASKGTDISGVAVNFIKESTTDGDWELFQVVFPPERQMPNQYAVLHLENNTWVVKNYGSAATIDGTPGMPADLKI
ncbi:MAG: IPT/TIG domain-containing protein [Actinobacteria bacterium]|nr:IPT/TIG domain-containing protein [Actinomycetota bacterium]MBU1944830.1 IPT/TIG domain-containing protein [Actinomycetota bacterium]MBU2687103.1 IPT/TIG domain-containing protein [Actinomycetota bacterium]